MFAVYKHVGPIVHVSVELAILKLATIVFRKEVLKNTSISLEFLFYNLEKGAGNTNTLFHFLPFKELDHACSTPMNVYIYAFI